MVYTAHPTFKNKGQYFCSKCKTWQDQENWYYRKNEHKTRDGMCKPCRKEYRKDAKKIHSKKYYEEHRDHYLELQRKWREDNVERKLWYSTKNSAKARNLEFNLTVDDIIVPDRCPVFDIPLDTHAESHTGSGINFNKNPYRPSVDRIDNTKGYVKGNIQVISWRANSIKKDATVEELQKLYEHMRRTN